MTSGHRMSDSATRPTSAHALPSVPSVVLSTTRPTIREAAPMRITTLYLDDTASVSRMSAPVPDPQPAQPAPTVAALAAAREAAWDAFERATFPDLTR